MYGRRAVYHGAFHRRAGRHRRTRHPQRTHDDEVLAVLEQLAAA